MTAAQIREKLATNNAWLERAVLAIYEHQTADEQDNDTTRYHNRVGFNSCDAPLLSSFARQIQDWKAGRSRHLTPLSPKQYALARRKMAKYCGQLAKIAAAKRAELAAAVA